MLVIPAKMSNSLESMPWMQWRLLSNMLPHFSVGRKGWIWPTHAVVLTPFLLNAWQQSFRYSLAYCLTSGSTVYIRWCATMLASAVVPSLQDLTHYPRYQEDEADSAGNWKCIGRRKGHLCWPLHHDCGLFSTDRWTEDGVGKPHLDEDEEQKVTLRVLAGVTINWLVDFMVEQGVEFTSHWTWVQTLRQLSGPLCVCAPVSRALRGCNCSESGWF